MQPDLKRMRIAPDSTEPHRQQVTAVSSLTWRCVKLEEDLGIENPPKGMRKRLERIAQVIHGDDYVNHIQRPVKQVLESLWNETY